MMKNENGSGNPAMRRYRSPRRRQHGVVLLALILVVLVGSSWLLLGKLNQSAQDYARDVQTRVVLKEAKQALIRYAVSYPELHEDSSRIAGPGYLPCPDQDPGAAPDHTEDMVAQTNCAESTGTTLGRLPTRDLGLDNLVDAAGERLWYAVAQEYKNNQSSGHVMNSETPASLRVDGDDEEIVAVVIAPGVPINGQDGRGDALEELYADPTPTKDWHEVVAEYLEDDNATTTDGEFVTVPTAAGSPPTCTDGSLDEDQIEQQCFNDTLITITRRELMAAVEARVANDVRDALEGYRTAAGGAFPWLAPYSDPKRGGRYGGGLGGYGVSGRHTGSGSSTQLTDTSARFVTLGVANGDRIWNVSDGSYGTVTSVTSETQVVFGSLEGGDDNNFAAQDLYFIEAAALDAGTPLAGTAGAGSAGSELEAAVDLQAQGVVPGDVVDKVDVNGAIEGSAGIVAIDGDTLELDTATGIDFQPGNEYRVRSPFGTVTAAASSPTSLEDDIVRFATDLGVTADDVVLNLTDGSHAVVIAVTDNTLTVDELVGGADNDFDPGDRYALVRHLPEALTRFGKLPVHEMGKPFITDFSVAWSLLSSSGHAVTVSAPGAVSTYTTAITNWVQRSTLYSDAPTDDESYPDAVPVDADVQCTWAGVNIVDCRGSFNDTEFMRADVDSVSVSGSIISITDTGSRFNYAGVRQGAKVRNLTQPGLADGIVHAASSATQNLINVVTVDDFNPPFTVAAGDEIRVYVASKRTPTVGAIPSSYTANGSSVPGKVCADGANFWSFIGSGDTIRLTTTGTGNPVGQITGAPEADCVTYTDLQGGLTSSIDIGQRFRIQYDFVEERRWTFNVRMAGDVGLASGAAGARQRSVCQGFGTSCETENSDAVYMIGSMSGTSTSGSGGVVLEDSGMNFTTLSIAVGDAVFNVTDGSSGHVSSVGSPNANTLTVNSLVGGSDNTFSLGDLYAVNPVIRFQDFDQNGILLASAGVTVPANGAAQGSLMASKVNLLLAEDADEDTTEGFLPRWFLRNRWQEYAFASYSDALSPDNVASSTDNCITGTDCLSVHVSLPANTQKHDRKAVVVMAGAQLGGQDRSSGSADAYYESENADADLAEPFQYSIFGKEETDDTFNDQLSVVIPCASPDEYKAWPDCD